MEKPRRTYTPEQKVSILREHLIERTPVSDLCDKLGIHPILFYQWQKTFFERGAAAFETGRSPSRDLGNRDRKLEALENKLAMRSEALAELMEEHMRLKKVLGSPEGALDAP